MLDPESARRVEVIENVSMALVFWYVTANKGQSITASTSLAFHAHQPIEQNSDAYTHPDIMNEERQQWVVDHTKEDFNRDECRASGFLGAQSEILWLYRLKEKLQRRPIDSEAHAARCGTFDRGVWASYATDDIDFQIDIASDVLHVPPRHVAQDLFDTYISAIHPSFPIISEIIFTKQLNYFFSQQNPSPGRKWLAILNLVFASASVHKHIAYHEESPHREYNDRMYFSRAWVLYNGESSLSTHPDLQQVQVEGLISFYLLSVGQINRYAVT